ncbi:MAG TPA: TIGR03617 family F420-dependent LLM class oxidoreductase [Dehalococcoidia bacterium]|nr:TIGR03617 family F420-dependent LLM class oxidoreductase [Dehalococcoidia bacterium]
MGFKVLYHLTTNNLKGIAEEAKWAESMGYDGLCTEDAAHDPMLPLLMAASTTSRVTLETRVTIAFPRSPMVLAYSARDLQDFSGGRFRLGLGTQVKGHIQRRFSTEWDSPGPRMREYVQSLHAIWGAWQTGERLEYHGEYYNFSLMTPFFSPGRSEQPEPPVFISAVNPYNCRVAGEVCDGVALHPLTTSKYLKEVINPNIADGAARSGRDPKSVNLSNSSFVITGPNQAAINAKKEAVKKQIAFYCSTRSYSKILDVQGFQDLGVWLHEMSLKQQWDQMAELITDKILDAFAVVGGYSEIPGLMKERFDGLLDEVVLNAIGPGSQDEAEVKKAIEKLQS